MSTTLITSALSVLAVSISSFATFFKAITFKKRNKEDIAFSLCWLTAGFIFLFIFIRLIFFNYNLIGAVRLAAYLNQVVLFFLFVSFGYYIFYIEIKYNYLRQFLFILMIISGFFFLFYLFSDGIVGPIISDWGVEYTSPPSSNAFLVFAGALSIFFLIFYFLKQSFYWLAKKEVNVKRLLSYFSLLLFVSAGIFEQLGNANWLVLFFRIIILISSLIAFSIYLFYGSD